MVSKRIQRLSKKHFGISDMDAAFAELKNAGGQGALSPEAKALLENLGPFLADIEGVFTQYDERLHIAVRNLEISSAELNTANRNLERLRHAQKMEALGKLTGGIAHDFNNLLQIIMGQTESLLKAAKAKWLLRKSMPDLEKQLETILTTAERGAELIEHMLIFAREQPMEPRVIEVNSTLRGIESMMRRGLGANVQLEMDLPNDPPAVFVDKLQLETSLLNIAFNARDAMPEGGVVTVKVRKTMLAGNETFAQGQQPVPGEYIEISIMDTGTGIPAEILDKIFDPFYTTKEPGKGTGLGLSLVLGFVNNAGGYISVKSRHGEGATFTVLLPVCTQEQMDALLDTSKVIRREKPKGHHILVIEDNENVRELVSKQLMDAGYLITAAENADKALEILRRSGNHFDLVFSDLFMPGKLKGLDIVREFRKHNAGLKFLMASGYADTAMRKEEGTSLSNVKILKKPYRTEVLLEAIAAELRGGGQNAA